MRGDITLHVRAARQAQASAGGPPESSARLLRTLRRQHKQPPAVACDGGARPPEPTYPQYVVVRRVLVEFRLRESGQSGQSAAIPPGARGRRRLVSQLSALHRQQTRVLALGDCFFDAVGHQLDDPADPARSSESSAHSSISMLQLRKQVRDYMRTHAPATWRRLQGDATDWDRLIAKQCKAGTQAGWAGPPAIRALACALERHHHSERLPGQSAPCRS